MPSRSIFLASGSEHGMKKGNHVVTTSGNYVADISEFSQFYHVFVLNHQVFWYRAHDPGPSIFTAKSSEVTVLRFKQL